MYFCGRRFSRKVLLEPRVRGNHPYPSPQPTTERNTTHFLLDNYNHHRQGHHPLYSAWPTGIITASRLLSYPIHFVKNILSKRPRRFKNPALAERGRLTLSQAPSKRGIARRAVIVSAQGTGRPWAATLVSFDRYPIPTPPRSSEASGHLENPGTASQRGCMSRHRGKIPNLKSHPPPPRISMQGRYTDTHLSGFWVLTWQPLQLDPRPADGRSTLDIPIVVVSVS